MMPLYFAFGSNMDGAQMARRCPGSTALGLATLRGHRLVFRGPSRNRGGGVLSVDLSSGDEVHGVLYQVTEAHLVALDRFEGAPAWYKRVACQVSDAGGQHLAAVIYRLPVTVVEMPPTPAYLQQVEAAFETHGLELACLIDAVRRSEAAVR